MAYHKHILLLTVQQNREKNKADTKTNFFGLICSLTYETGPTQGDNFQDWTANQKE